MQQDQVSPLFNQSLEKGLAVLSAFGAERKTMNLAEVASAAGISKSSAQRMIFTLEALGYIRKHPQSRRYRLTLRTFDLGFNYLAADTLIDFANPFLAELCNVCDETVALTEPDGLQMVYVARFTSHKHVPIHMPLGSRVPMYCTASGRAYLSGRTREETMQILGRSDRVRHTQHTRTDLDEIVRMVDEARWRGFAYNNEEYYLGDLIVGAPIVDSLGRAIASVHIAAPTSRWVLEEAVSRLGPQLLECARAISNAVRTVDWE